MPVPEGATRGGPDAHSQPIVKISGEVNEAGGHVSASLSQDPFQPKKTVELQRRMLARGQKLRAHQLTVNNVFDKVGNNGVFSAMPSVVKFAGYELGKTHTLKVKLLNNSPVPQRLHILPPATSQFKIKYSKKGMIPTGVSEDIYVQFTPGQEYKYFYDSIRIHCEGDKILIPMHAYPVINTLKDTLLPQKIEMGSNCKVGKTYEKEYVIESNCPVNFEFQIKDIMPHPDIRVMPMAGDIVGLTDTPILFSYNPHSFTTAEAQFELRTSEFDFTPQIITVVGSAVPQKVNVQDFYDQEELEAIDGQAAGKTLLTDKSIKKSRAELTMSETKSRSKRTLKPLSESHVKSSALSTHKGMGKLSGDELTFLNDYKRIEELEKQKGIKFFECIGDPPIEQDFVDRVEVKR
jgi:hypothetical protein